MTQDLKKMSKKQLEKLKKDVEKALAGLATKEKREAKKAAEKAVAKYGFSLADITGGAAAPAKAAKRTVKKASPAKYANPDNAEQTWTGKGRQPQWFKAAVDAGKDPASMEI